MGRFILNFQQLRDGEGNPASWVQVFKTGEFEHFMGDFVVDESFLSDMVANFKQTMTMMNGNPFAPIDFNHANLADGETAKAAGWIVDLEIRDSSLFAKVEWTPKAAEMIKNKEFRFISPEFSTEGHKNEFGEKIEGPFLHAAALTNMPFLKGMEPVTLKQKRKEATSMPKVDELLKTLKLKNEDELVKLVETLQTQAADSQKIIDSLELKEGEKPVDVIKKLKADKGKLIEAMDSLKKDVHSLKEKEHEKNVSLAVSKAIQDGKILPAQKEQMSKIALKDLESFDELMKVTPKVMDYDSIGSTEGDTTETGNPIKDFDAEVRKVAVELNANNPDAAYAKAYTKVSKEKPELLNAYTKAHQKRIQ